MLQRVGLAQSLINDPEIVFLDEPMSGLDPIGRREVRELIASLRDQGKTVFMSTHILSDVEALCDEVAILRKGKLAASGTLDELLASQAEGQVFEITLRGLLADGFTFSGIDDVTDRHPRHGITVRVDDESQIESVLVEARKQGGQLVSVQPTKQSLEELSVSCHRRLITCSSDRRHFPTNIRSIVVPLEAVNGQRDRDRFAGAQQAHSESGSTRTLFSFTTPLN